jgi:uncharacterized protein YprB with RNaseH-like and TPR domain
LVVPDEQDPLALRLARLRQLMQEASQRASDRLAAGQAISCAAGEAVPRPAGEAVLRAAGQAVPRAAQHPGDAVPLEALMRGDIVSGGGRECFMRHQTLDVGHRHGRYKLETAMVVDRPGLLWLAQPSAVDAADLSGAVFVDLETTGLSGGTGTLAFLVGLAWFDDGQLHLAQLFMRGPHEEPALLQHVSDIAGGRELVVGFNSRAFDIPLMETRFVLGRRRSPFPADHVDLLTPARRVWRLRLASCRLANLEERVLGVTRHDDVPGWMIPQLYTEYLRTGDARPLAPVFDHNLLDVLSLVTLAGRLGELHRDPRSALADDPTDLVALARCFERRPHEVAGESLSHECYQEALRHGLSGLGAEVARLRLALGHKQRGQWDHARGHWLAVVAEGSAAARQQALIELAKWAEHKARDPLSALAWAREAFAADVGPQDSGDGPDGAGGASSVARGLRRRIARLESKLQRS